VSSVDHLRSVFVPGFLGPTGGGASRSACLHATSLAERGLPVLVEGLDDPAGGLADLVLHSCDTREHPWTGPVDEPVSPALVRRVRRIADRVDVVHLNGHFQVAMHRVARVCREAGIPYVVSSRATLDPSALADRPAERLAELAEAEAEYIAGATAVHVTSRVEHLRAAEHLSAHPRVVTMPNAVDLDELRTQVDRAEARRQLGLPDGPALLYYGRLVHQKRPDHALDVLSRLPADHRMYIVGDGTDEARRELVEHARALRVADRVRFVRHAHGHDRSLWLTAADVLLVPSLMENFCLAVVEAAALSLPVVSAELVGAVQYLEVTDVRVVPRDLDMWVTAVRESVAAAPRPDPDQRFARLREQFRPAGVLALWEPVYAQVEAEPARPGRDDPRQDLLRFATAAWPTVTGADDPLTVVEEVAGGVSGRLFLRVGDVRGRRAVAMACPERQGDFLAAPFDSTEPLEWVRVRSALAAGGVPVPDLLASEEHGFLLVEDLGSSRLDLELRAHPGDAARLLAGAVGVVLDLQAATDVVPRDSLPLRRRYDVATLVWEMFHHLEWGVEARYGVRIGAEDRLALLDGFRHVADELAGSPPVLVHRDFNATNLVPRGDAWGVVDFDDALLGPMVYDLCSLLLDVNLQVDRESVDAHVRRFHRARSARLPGTPNLTTFRRLFDLQAVQRNLKVAGRFVWLDRLGGSSRYVDHVDTALAHVRHHLRRHPDLAELGAALARVDPALAT
jgi:N-acetylmuramate 1-kinase